MSEQGARMAIGQSVGRTTATARRRLSFTGAEWTRLGGMYGFILVLHVIGWGFFLHYRNSFGLAYAGAGTLAYTFGLRHAFDADHIAAVDDTTRFLMQSGKKPLGVGFFFSLGHSTIVFLLSFGLALAAKYVARHYQAWHDIGGVVGASVSATFLWIVGILNLVVLIGIVKLYRRAKQGDYDRQQLEDLLTQRGFMNRILGSRFRSWLSSSWQMYPVGVLFGLGFDTASEVALLAITAGAATATSATGDTLPFWGIVALPVLFAAGMSFMDTTDGVMMSKAYSWAFDSPLRKMYYNMTTTGLSVLVALLVGTVEYLQVVSTHFGWDDSGFFYWLNNTLDFEHLGYLIVAMFLIAWLGSVAWYKGRRIEERWSHMIPDDPEVRPGGS